MSESLIFLQLQNGVPDFKVLIEEANHLILNAESMKILEALETL